MRSSIVLMLLAVTTTGCGAIAAKMDRITPTSEQMAGIKIIQVIDKTDPLILQGTNAGAITDLIHTALKGKGYEPCAAPCQADATATVNVTKFSRHVSYSPITSSVSPKSVMFFTFQIRNKSGALLMNHLIRHSQSTAQRDLMVIGVQELASYIPAAK